jgi:hypothetical protein
MVRQDMRGASVRWERMTRRGPLLLALLAACACALGLAACGGSDDEDASAILAETFGEGKDVSSGRLDLSLRLTAQGLANVNGPVALRLSGPFQSSKEDELPRFDFQVAFDAGGQNLSAGAVSTGEKGFVRFQQQAYALSDQLYKQFKDGYAEQAKCNAERGGEGVSFSTLGIRPGRWLKDPKTAGSEEVGGAETTHITAGVDVPRMLEDVNTILGRTDAQPDDPCAKEQQGQPQRPTGRQLSEDDRRRIADAIKDARVDVWTGEEDRTLRRINVLLRFEVPEDQRRRTNGLRSGDLRFDLTIGALNEEQRIAEPSGARPLDELVAQFGGQVPGLDGGAGAQPGGGTAQPSEPSSEYDRCVQEAGADITKLQACQDLVGR